MWKLIALRFKNLLVLAIFVPILLSVLYLTVTRDQGYLESELFVRQDDRLALEIGSVKKVNFKFWNGFEFSGSNGNFIFEVATERGIFIVDVRIRQFSGVWHVVSADFRDAKGQYQRLSY